MTKIIFIPESDVDSADLSNASIVDVTEGNPVSLPAGSYIPFVAVQVNGDVSFVLTDGATSVQAPIVAIVPAATTIPWGTLSGSTVATVSFGGDATDTVTLSGPDETFFELDGTSLNITSDALPGTYSVTVTGTNTAGSDDATHELTVESATVFSAYQNGLFWEEDSTEVARQTDLVTTALESASAPIAGVPYNLTTLAGDLRIGQVLANVEDGAPRDQLINTAAFENALKPRTFVEAPSMLTDSIARLPAGVTTCHIHTVGWHRETSIPLPWAALLVDANTTLAQMQTALENDYLIPVKAALDAAGIVPATIDIFNEPVHEWGSDGIRNAWNGSDASSRWMTFADNQWGGLSNRIDRVAALINWIAGIVRGVFGAGPEFLVTDFGIGLGHPQYANSIDETGSVYTIASGQPLFNNNAWKRREDTFLALMGRLAEMNADVQGVGFQDHLRTNDGFSIEECRRTMAPYKALGYSMHSLEFNFRYEDSAANAAFDKGTDDERQWSLRSSSDVLRARGGWIESVFPWTDATDNGDSTGWTLWGREVIEAGDTTPVGQRPYGIQAGWLAYARFLEDRQRGVFDNTTYTQWYVPLHWHLPPDLQSDSSPNSNGMGLPSGRYAVADIVDLFRTLDPQLATFSTQFTYSGGDGTLFSIGDATASAVVQVSGGIAQFAYDGTVQDLGPITNGVHRVTMTVASQVGVIAASMDGTGSVEINTTSLNPEKIAFGHEVGAVSNWTSAPRYIWVMARGDYAPSDSEILAPTHAEDPTVPRPLGVDLGFRMPPPDEAIPVPPYDVIYAYNFDGADEGGTPTYTINGRDITDGNTTSVSTGYSIESGTYYGTTGALIFRNTSDLDAPETASFDLSSGTPGAMYQVRASVRCNNFNSNTGTLALRIEWQDDAGAVLGTIFSDPAVSVATDALIIDEEYTSIMPTGATRIRFTLDPNVNVWGECAFALNFFGVAGPGGTDVWALPTKTALGGDLGTVSQVTVLGETLTFASPVQVIQHPDGTMHVPVGAQLTGQTTTPANGKHQVMLNPTYDANAEWQAFDINIEDYDTTEQGGYTHTFSDGDVFVASVSNLSAGSRDGRTQNKFAFYCTATTPDPEAPPPNLVRSRADVGNLPALVPTAAIDWAARLATLPTYSVTSAARAPINGIPEFYRVDIGLNMDRSATRGYEHYMNHGALGSRASGGKNYGEALVEANDYLMTIFDDAYTQAERLAAYRAVACWGIQLMRSAVETGMVIGSDGGHFQFYQAACLIGLHALDQVNAGPLSDWLFINGRGNWKQAIQFSAADIAAAVPHSNDYNSTTPGPITWFLHNVNRVEGDRVFIEGDNHGQITFEGLSVFEQGNGTPIGTVLEMGREGSGGNNVTGTEEFYIDVPAGNGANFTQGNKIHFNWRGDVVPAVGEYHWSINGTMRGFSPSTQTGYVRLQSWVASTMIAKLVGATRAEYDAVIGYMTQAESDPDLRFLNSGESQYLADFRTQHWTTITAL